MKTVTRESLTAHNTRKRFPCSNEAYNKEHKLGTPEERLFLEGISEDEYGTDNKHEKLSKKFLFYCGVVV